MNDSFDRNLVVLIFLFSFGYLNYLSLQIRSKSGWSNVTCNPINLFTNSIFQSQEDANKDFEKCVVSLSAATTTSMFKKQRSDQEKVITNLSGIEKKYDTLSSKVENYTKEVTSVVNDYNNKINDVKNTQKDANKLNYTTTENIDKYLASIQDIFGNITSYFKI
jgi:hypothetical protein